MHACARVRELNSTRLNILSEIARARARAIKNVLTREENIWIAAMFVTSIDDIVSKSSRVKRCWRS
jgi:GAF domain-containing protein